MSEKEPAKRSFWSKNIGPMDRMLWALIGLIIMTVGFEGFNALDFTVNGIGIVLVFIGFVVFLQAPVAWSISNAISRRSTFEKEEEAK